LNDENEKINYKNIPAELAWEMNLPLPDNYKFVFLGIFGAGSDAMDKFLRHCGVKMNLRVNNNYKRYLNAYEHMLCNKNNYNAIVLSGHKVLEDSTKLFFLIQKKVPYLCIVRDPISLLKPLVNHHQGGNKRIIRHISMDFDYKTYLENVILYHNTIRNNDGLKHSFDCIPSLNNIYRYLDGNMNILNWRVKHLQHSINKIYYFDMDKIRKEHAFETFLELSQIFGFKKPTNRNFFEAKVCRNDILVLLPLNLDIKLDAYGINANKDTLEITISTRQISFLSEHYLDITHLLIGDQCYFDNIVCFCQKKDFAFLKTNQKLFFDVQKFIKNLLIMMSEQEIKEQKKMFDEDDILDYLRANSDARNALRNIFNSDYKDLKELEPDIVASWKYYQEFEKMCKELDGN
ncbi:DUF2972 domain-containing protein, partial [Campylobacter lari]|uniref:DUF2972 domain-containing protein n=1 Tax=Campylobacter lari TaxID=201 RepID=UPI0021F7C314